MVEPNHTYRHRQTPTDDFKQLRIEALEKENKRLRKALNELYKLANEN